MLAKFCALFWRNRIKIDNRPRESGNILLLVQICRDPRLLKGSVNLGQLSDFVITEVGKKSIVVNNKSQTPTVLAGSEVASYWRNLNM